MAHFFSLLALGEQLWNSECEVEGWAVEHVWNIAKASLPVWSPDEIWLL